MKISLMVLLMATIAVLSHFAIAGLPRERVAPAQLPRGTGSFRPRLAITDRNMWISIFAVAIAAAVCLAIAVFLIQPVELA